MNWVYQNEFTRSQRGKHRRLGQLLKVGYGCIDWLLWCLLCFFCVYVKRDNALLSLLYPLLPSQTWCWTLSKTFTLYSWCLEKQNNTEPGVNPGCQNHFKLNVWSNFDIWRWENVDKRLIVQWDCECWLLSSTASLNMQLSLKRPSVWFSLLRWRPDLTH